MGSLDAIHPYVREGLEHLLVVVRNRAEGTRNSIASSRPSSRSCTRRRRSSTRRSPNSSGRSKSPAAPSPQPGRRRMWARVPSSTTPAPASASPRRRTREDRRREDRRREHLPRRLCRRRPPHVRRLSRRVVVCEPAPGRAAHDVANRSGGYPELSCYDRSGHTTSAQLAYTAHIGATQFCVAVSLASIVAAMLTLVTFIRSLIAPGEVSRIAARAVPAQVARLLTGWTRAVRLLCNDLVRERNSLFASPHAYAPVAEQQEARERPALVEAALVDLCPEAVMEWCRSAHRGPPRLRAALDGSA